jgi:hypothetical protein
MKNLISNYIIEDLIDLYIEENILSVILAYDVETGLLEISGTMNKDFAIRCLEAAANSLKNSDKLKFNINLN